MGRICESGTAPALIWDPSLHELQEDGKNGELFGVSESALWAPKKKPPDKDLWPDLAPELEWAWGSSWAQHKAETFSRLVPESHSAKDCPYDGAGNMTRGYHCKQDTVGAILR